MSRAKVGLQGSFIVGGSSFLGNSGIISDVNLGYNFVLHRLEMPIQIASPFGNSFSPIAFQIQC
jgi:hypothetical protein